MRPVILTLLLLPFIYIVSAQATTGFSGTGYNIDVKYHRFEWNINPDNPIYIGGSVTTYFVTTEAGVNKVTFDLNKNSYNNSSLKAYYHGTIASASFPSSGNNNVLTIDLPVSLAAGVLDSVTVQYGGTPPAPSGGPGGCFQKTINGYPLFYTLSESYEDKDWWPCKADMQDKIDSMDIIITSPQKFTAAANGMLVSEAVSGGDKISVFKHRYPIASYQVGIAVSQYVKYDRGTVNINGTEVPIIYYVLEGRNPTAAQLAKFDLCKDEMIAFSALFGDYPYKKEKYGMYEFGFGGGMEHPTFSGMSWGAFTTPYIVAHELMHQWFGDKVTMATWNHLWLSEGFASYGEVLAAEKVPATGMSAINLRANKKNNANGNAQRTYGCYIPDTYIVNSNTLWSSQYGNTVYTRGGMVVSMLRTLMGDDKFFQACRNYLNDPQLAYGAATTADLQAHLEAVLGGFDLTGFFNSFVYGNGFPNYGDGAGNSIKWQDIGGGKIRFRVDAPARSTGSNVGTYFSVIPLRVKGAGGEEKLIVLYDQGSIGVSVGGDGIIFGNSPTPEADLGFTPVSVDFDPYNMSLAMGVTTKTTVAPVTVTSFRMTQNSMGNLATVILSFDQKPTRVELEKSTDGVRFTLAGAMTAIAPNQFRYQDVSSSETVFYRAKITEATGLVTYSRIESVAGDPVQHFRLLTNPVQNMLEIRVPSDMNDKTFQLSIFDFTGRKLLSVEKSPLNGILRVDPGSLTKGVYLIHIQSSINTQTLRFILSK